MNTPHTLVLRPRRIWPSVVVAAVVVGIAIGNPLANIYVGASGVQPRTINVMEWGPLLFATSFAVGLSPRFDDWELHGARCTRRLALANLATIVAAPILLFGVVAATHLDGYPEWVGVDSPFGLLPFLNNIVILSLLAVILVAAVGPLVGTLAWAVTAYSLFVWQSTVPAYFRLLPVNMYIRPGGEVMYDTAIRWGWIAALAIVAVVLAWTRRLVPIRISIRPPEED